MERSLASRRSRFWSSAEQRVDASTRQERIWLVQEKLLNEQNRDVKLEVAVGLLPKAMALVLGGEVPGGHAVRPDGRNHLLGFRMRDSRVVQPLHDQKRLRDPGGVLQG